MFLSMAVDLQADPPYDVTTEAAALHGSAHEAPACCEAPSRLAALQALRAKSTPSALTIEPNENGVDVLIGGELFAGYVTSPDTQPSVWPIIGPSGHEMTRSFPLGEAKPAEKTDHPHHRSLWFAHGNVNGHDFWHSKHAADAPPRIVHQGFVRQATNEQRAEIVTENAWMAGDSRILTDERTLRFGRLPSDDGAVSRYVDFDIRLIASEGAVTFGDTKEGTFAVRVPGTMKLDAGFGGRVTNEHGAEDGAAWGQPAAWVDYHGPLEAPSNSVKPTEGGIVIMSHPTSFRPECRWHVRGYGLFAANPFGESDFPPGGSTQGATTLAAGEELSLRYRVVFYTDAAEPSQLRSWYTDYTATEGLESAVAPPAAGG